jgi:hypothetical protein
MEPTVRIERLTLCFLLKFSQQARWSQGCSAMTRGHSTLLVYCTATEEFTECDMRSHEQLFVMDTS